VQIEINGESRDIAAETSLHELVSELSLPPERVAIELNQKVVRRSDWPTTMIAAGDRLEIVNFVGGG